MSIASELNNLSTNISNAYDAVETKGGTIPTNKNMVNLPTAIESISAGGSFVGIPREVSSGGIYQVPADNFTFSLPANATSIGPNALYYAFNGCTSLTSVDLSSLTTLTGSYALDHTFYNCTGLTSVDLSSLTTLTGSYALYYAFSGCTRLTSLSFPALTTSSFGSQKSQFNNMLFGVRGCTVHFPASVQSTIGSWPSVTGGFSGTNTTVLFDL